MQKHYSWYPWLMAALIIGILVCIGLIVYMLVFRTPLPAFHPGVQLVKEAFFHAMA